MRGQPNTPENPRVTGVFGTLLVAIAGAIAYVSLPDPSLGQIVVALVVGWLGVDALWSAARGRRSLVSRIGPSP